MKKKIGLIVLIIASTFLLTGCFGKEERKFDLTEFEDAVSGVVEQVNDSVVGVLTDHGDNTGSTGSGIIYKVEGSVSKKYFILTNHHVIEGAIGKVTAQVQIMTSEEVVISAKIYGFDADSDIAVLTVETVVKLQVKDIPEITTDNSKIEIKKGRFCIAIGSPLGMDNLNTASFGMISNVYLDWIQHTADINPGNSGGPLFNLQGQVIGINTQKIPAVGEGAEMTPIEGMGFAININFIGALVRSFNGA